MLKVFLGTVDTLWGLRRRPVGWLVLAAAVFVLGWNAWGYANEAVEWKGTVDAHLKRAPEVEAAAVKAWGEVGAKLNKLDEAQQRDGARLERIEDALIRQRVRERARENGQ